MKRLILFLISLVFLYNAPSVEAADMLASGTPQNREEISLPYFLADTAKVTDTRVLKLKNFLTKHNSPLSEFAPEFIHYADTYQLDWRLVPAISGVESTFGKHIPSGSFNAYGWAGGKYKFKSWEHSIEVVTKALKEKYVNRGADTLTEINRIYCPPNPNWGGKVASFMIKIDPSPIDISL